jgi:16S rRNA (uracil1498-N3)-methyltransferase
VITVLVPHGVMAGRREQLGDGEGHHLHVRRARAGDVVALRDGAGLVGTGRLAVAGHEWLVDVDRAERHPRPAALRLGVGAGDRERFAWVVEKAVELGATAVVPLETERTGGVATRLRDSHLFKLRRQVLEATKQSGAAWALDVESPARLADFAARGYAGHIWLAEVDGQPPPPVLDAAAVTVVIGPEGGLSTEERATLLGAGYRPTALGPHTLRFETAALAAAAAVTIARLRGAHG